MTIEERSVQIHEDFWGMRNLYPMTASDEVMRELDAATSAAERNRAPNGAGWTAVHAIKAPKTTFADVGLTLDQAKAALTTHMPLVERFRIFGTISAGDSPYDHDAICFGFGDHCFVKVDHKENRIAAIWFEMTSRSLSERAALRASFEAIDAIVPSLLVDYWQHIAGAISDETFLAHYFSN